MDKIQLGSGRGSDLPLPDPLVPPMWKKATTFPSATHRCPPNVPRRITSTTWTQSELFGMQG